MSGLPTPALRLPWSGAWARGLEQALESPARLRGRRILMQRSPFPVLASEVRDIVYLNWLVPVAQVRSLAPSRVTLWERNGLTVVTTLTYRHGHFGPTLLGPLRKLMPSPLQSNWRLYAQAIDGVPCDVPTVLFLSTLINSLLYTVGTRLASDALPLHLPLRFEHAWGNGTLSTRIAPGEGSAPDLSSRLSPRGDAARAWPDAWHPLFEDRLDALRFLCLQDRSVVPGLDVPEALAEGSIELPIDLSRVETMNVDQWSSAALEPWVRHAQPWGFLVPDVPFRVVGERWRPAPSSSTAEGPGKA